MKTIMKPTMKKYQVNQHLAGLIFLILSILTSFDVSGQGRWELLGQTVVSDRLDRDVVQVGSRRGDYSALRIQVAKGRVDFHRMQVVFGNGTVHEVNLRPSIRRGGRSRVIDLPGRERYIQEIVFWYDSRSLRNKRSVVRVYGRA
jgi:hypothetical protein